MDDEAGQKAGRKALFRPCVHLGQGAEEKRPTAWLPSVEPSPARRIRRKAAFCSAGYRTPTPYVPSGARVAGKDGRPRGYRPPFSENFGVILRVGKAASPCE